MHLYCTLNLAMFMIILFYLGLSFLGLFHLVLSCLVSHKTLQTQVYFDNLVTTLYNIDTIFKITLSQCESVDPRKVRSNISDDIQIIIFK